MLKEGLQHLIKCHQENQRTFTLFVLPQAKNSPPDQRKTHSLLLLSDIPAAVGVKSAETIEAGGGRTRWAQTVVRTPFRNSFRCPNVLQAVNKLCHTHHKERKVAEARTELNVRVHVCFRRTQPSCTRIESHVHGISCYSFNLTPCFCQEATKTFPYKTYLSL